MKFSKLRKFLVLFLIPLAFVVIFSGTGAVHATTVTPDTGAEEGQVDSVTSDNNDATTLGLSLSTNSDETSLSGTLQILYNGVPTKPEDVSESVNVQVAEE